MFTERMKAHLERILKAMTAEAAACFRAAVDGAHAQGWGAFAAGFKALRKAFERKADAWVKRAAPLDDPAEAPPTAVFACPVCRAAQPGFACGTCGDDGPPNCCFRCGCGMNYAPCPDCGARWNPVPTSDMSTRSEDQTILLPMELLECRAAEKDVGIVKLWVSADTKDSHGTVVGPVERTLELIKPGETRVDVEHDEKPRDGVTIGERTLAKRPWTDKEGKVHQATGVSTEFICDLRTRGGREVHGGFLGGGFTGGSLAFFPESAQQLADVRAGKSDKLTPRAIPFISCVAKPSNGVSTLLEVRSERSMAPAPENTTKSADTPTTPPTLDQAITDLKEVAAQNRTSGTPDAKPGSASASSPETKPSPEEKPDRIAELLARVEAQDVKIASLVTASEANKALETRAAAAEARVATLETSLTEQRQKSLELVQIVTKIVGEIPAMMEERIARAKGTTTRIGATGPTTESEAIEALARLQSATKEALKRDAELAERAATNRLFITGV